MKQSTPVPTKYPKGAYFILAGYLLERFVYYGMFGGSVFYMQRVLNFTSSEASTIKSVTEGLIYLAPIIGAVIADSFFGKFKLVFAMCCGYLVGATIYSLSAATPIMTTVAGTQATGIGGLLILGLCAGLMKAVYSSLGPDQFKLPEQRLLQKRFFFFFYWMINAGAFCGQMLTAQLRGTVQCFGGDCFLLPYGILVVFMALSTIVFYAGKNHYVEAPPDTMVIRTMQCLKRAAVLKFSRNRSRDKSVKHWIDRATFPGKGQVTDLDLIADIKKTLGVLLLFTTYPLFWALFYQTSTGMIFQAKRLVDYVGTYRIPAELTSSINPLLILILIPLFDLLIFPLLNRFKLLTRITSRMTVGMLFAVAAFIVYGLLNMQVEQVILGRGEAKVQIYNARECDIKIMGWDETPWNISANEQIVKMASVKQDYSNESRSLKISVGCGVQRNDLEEIKITLREEHQTTVMVDTFAIKSLPPTLDYIKDEDADAKFRITSLLSAHSTSIEEYVLRYKEMNVSMVVTHGNSQFKTLPPQPYEVINVKTNVMIGEVEIRQDGVYDIILTNTKNISVFEVTSPSDIHVLWTIPQYLIMTIGEVLFSVSGMDFAYTEAPKAMKSVMSAANLLTITVGLWVYALLTAITSSTGLFEHTPSREAFTYSALMLIDTMVFFVLVRRYNRLKEEVEYVSTGPETIDEKPDRGQDNPAYDEEKV